MSNILRLEEDVFNRSDWIEERKVVGLDEKEEPIIEKSLFITGIFGQSEVKNGNGRLYPNHVLAEAVRRVQMDIKSGASWGEMGHPIDGRSRFERACIMTTELHMEGNDAIGKAKVMNRDEIPLGKLLYGLLKEGVKVGVSTRGRGQVDRSNRVKDGFYFVKPVDVVEDPSAPDAFVTAIEEKKDWLVNESMMNEQDYYMLRQSIIESKRSGDFDTKKLEILKAFVRKF